MPRKKLERNVAQARKLRDEMSLPAVLLWRLLRSAEGVKLRRQHPLGAYVLDFYCAEAKVAFEIDGMGHDMGNRPQRDLDRDAWLKQQGIEVVRILASEALRSPEETAEAIVRCCQR